MQENNEQIELENALDILALNKFVVEHISLAEQYVNTVHSSEALIIQQPLPTDPLGIVVLDKEHAAKIYHRHGVDHVSQVLREPPILGTRTILFNAFNHTFVATIVTQLDGPVAEA